MRDLRESGSIGNDANTVIFIHRTDPQAIYQDMIPIQFLVKKQRNGPLGPVDMMYRRQYLRFDEVTEG